MKDPDLEQRVQDLEQKVADLIEQAEQRHRTEAAAYQRLRRTMADVVRNHPA